MVREVPLTKGRVALVDDEDFDLVMDWRWHLSSNARGNTHYAQTSVRDENGKYRAQSMHRVIMAPPPGLQVDHINRNGLDNRRCNLRWATPSQNKSNTRRIRLPLSGFVGVYAHGKNGFRVLVAKEGAHIHGGTFASAEEAARARDKLALKLHGEFAVLNFPEAVAA